MQRRENCHLATFNFQCFSFISHSAPQNLHNYVLFLLLFVYLLSRSYCVVLEVEGVLCKC